MKAKTLVIYLLGAVLIILGAAIFASASTDITSRAGIAGAGMACIGIGIALLFKILGLSYKKTKTATICLFIITGFVLVASGYLVSADKDKLQQLINNANEVERKKSGLPIINPNEKIHF